jgi:hypothetical protein
MISSLVSTRSLVLPPLVFDPLWFLWFFDGLFKGKEDVENIELIRKTNRNNQRKAKKANQLVLADSKA